MKSVSSKTISFDLCLTQEEVIDRKLVFINEPLL